MLQSINKGSRKLRLFIGVLLGLIAFFAGESFAQSERHSYVTAKHGDLYIFLKVGAPMTPEQMFFMSKVNGSKNLRVLTHFQQMTPEELREFGGNPETYSDKYRDPNHSYSKKEIERFRKGVPQFKMNKLEDLSMVSSLNVNTFPSMVYLTPDGFIYRFPFMPYKSNKPIDAFWQAYQKHKDKGKKMWLEKQWSQ